MIAVSEAEMRSRSILQCFFFITFFLVFSLIRARVTVGVRLGACV